MLLITLTAQNEARQVNQDLISHIEPKGEEKMDKVICNMDKVTHVIIDGKEYEKWNKELHASPEGKALLVALPCKLQKVTNAKTGKEFQFYAQIGSFWGIPVGTCSLKLTLTPSSTKRQSESAFAV